MTIADNYNIAQCLYLELKEKVMFHKNDNNLKKYILNIYCNDYVHSACS